MRWLENPIFPVSQAAMLPKGGQGAVNVMMKQYTGQNVMEALLDRLDYVFKEFDNINDIEQYVKKDLCVTRENAVKCEPGEYFICDLIGLDVITDEGEHIGKLTDVLETGANNVYEVTADNGKTILIPVIDQCILDHNLEEKTVTVHMLKNI